MSHVLVAGGAGFIGSHLCKKLLADGHTVICVDNLLTGSRSNVISLLDNPHFVLIQRDITRPLTDIAGRFMEIQYVFHLASPASPNKNAERSYVNFPIETLLVNSMGTHNLLEIAKDKDAHFLFASTSEVYGDPEVSPQPETYFGNVNPNGVRSVYDEGKRFGEAMTFAFRRKYGMNARIIRIFNTYGPNMQRDDGRVVSAFVTQALSNVPLSVYGSGEQTRSFCYVDDMVEGMIKAMTTAGTDGEVINLGNPDERKIIEIATMVKEMTGTSSAVIYEELPEDDPKRRNPDISKAKRLLKWEPKVSLEEGLRKTIAYFREQ